MNIIYTTAIVSDYRRDSGGATWSVVVSFDTTAFVKKLIYYSNFYIKNSSNKIHKMTTPLFSI